MTVIEHRDCDEDDPFGCICDDCNTRELSRAWERRSGHDSVATIERVYTRASSGAYVCIWPGCAVARHDPVVLWRHVHTAHGKSSLPPADFDPEPWL